MASVIFSGAGAVCENEFKGEVSMHAFLCRLQEILESTPAEQRPRILRDGRRAFQQMNAKNLQQKGSRNNANP